MNGDGTEHASDMQLAQASVTSQQSRGAEPVRTHEDVLHLIADVERQLERLRTAQVRSAEELAQFADRGRRLDERECEINAAAALLTAREAQLQAMADAVHDDEGRLGAHRLELDERERELTALKERTDADRTSLEAERARMASEREQLERDARILASERESLASLRTDVDRERAALQAEIATLNERLAALQGERDQCARERDESKSAERTQAAALAAAERNEASLMLVIAQLRERSEDAESSLASRDAVVEAKDAVIAEREQRIQELEREGESTRQSLRVAGEKLAALAKSVADQAPQLERGASAIALLNEQRLQLAELEQRINEKSQRIAALESELQTAREQAAAIPVVDTRAVDAATQELAVAKAQIDQLRAEMADAERLAAREREDRSSAATDALRNVESMQSQVEQALAFLATRKRRIDLARRLQREQRARREAEVREATENAMVRVLEEERLVKKQREELRHVQDVLTASERTMLMRYARHRGVLVAAWCMIVIAALGAGSWFASDTVLPRSAVASVDFVAKVRDDGAVTPEADTAFQSIHRGAIDDEGFRTAVKKRLSERGVQALKGNTEFDAWLDSVVIDSDGPGSMRLVAEGPDPQTAIIALDTLATTLVNESGKLTKGKGDVPRIAIAGSTQVPGRVSFSSIVPQEGKYDRIMAAGLLFSGVLTAGLIVGAFVFGRIAKAKRRFEDAERFGATL